MTKHRKETFPNELGCSYREGRAITAPALRQEGEKKKVFESESRPRWADENESEGENYMGKDVGEDEAIKLLKSRGFPHARKGEYQCEKGKEPYPEVKEIEDKMTTEGEAIGRHQRGRGGLPTRWPRRMRGSKEQRRPSRPASSNMRQATQR